jgi:glycosyltransferase involved in cell wall biosynthesis
MAELVDDGSTGLLFAPGDAADLAGKVERLCSSPQQRESMRHAARAEYERRYTAEPNYEQLIAIYHRAMGRTRRAGDVSPPVLAR